MCRPLKPSKVVEVERAGRWYAGEPEAWREDDDAAYPPALGKEAARHHHAGGSTEVVRTWTPEHPATGRRVQICGAKPSTVFAHVIPVSRGGRLLDPLNLQGAFWDCTSRMSILLPREDGRCSRHCECGRRECPWTPWSRDWYGPPRSKPPGLDQ